MPIEQTFFAIKPDALKYSVTGYILTMMSRTHLIYAASKVVRVNDILAREHYKEHEGKPFFEDLLKYIKGELHYKKEGDIEKDFPFASAYRRVVAFVYHGPNAVSEVRKAVGPTNPLEARKNDPGTIRAMGAVYTIEEGVEIYENLVHASATPEEAKREIQLWFSPEEFPPSLRILPTVESDRFFFLSPSGSLSESPEEGSLCIAAPGNILWEDDYNTLVAVLKGEAPPEEQNKAIAKYTLYKEG